MANRNRVVVLFLALGGCGGSSPSADAGVPTCGTTSVTVATVRSLDLLFVIDNSAGMAGAQDRLIAQIGVLLRTLADQRDGFPNTHIGIASTDLGTGPYASLCSPVGGDGGRLQHMARVPLCTPPGEPYINIENSDGQLSGNIANVDTPTEDGLGCQGLTDGVGNPIPADGDDAIDACDIQATFVCIAALGTGGCGFAQPLEVARRALTCNETECTNPGFRRSTAALGIVFMTDDDDCSARRSDLFNPADTATLGPATGFRCFEYGVTCSPPIDRTADQVLTGCRSKTEADVATLYDLYLYPVQEYYDFFSSLAAKDSVVLAGITGPHRSSDIIETVSGSFPGVAPSCTGPTVGSADPTVRVNELIRRLGTSGIVLQDVGDDLGICTDDYTPLLTSLAGAAAPVGPASGCLAGPLTRVTEQGPVAIADSSEASCTVYVDTDVFQAGPDGGAIYPTIDRCVLDSPAGSCASPPSLAATSPFPCWYVCDGSAPEAGDCPDQWRLRSCYDATCGSEADISGASECESCDPALCDCL